MKIFVDIDEALAALADDGGWLLDLGWDDRDGCVYGVTDDEGTVRDLRGQEFIGRCEKAQCWDETVMPGETSNDS